MNKHQQVREHLLTYGSITSWEAIVQYDATRLSAIIFDLRKSMDIDSIMMDDIDRNGNHVRYAKYVLKGEQK